MSKKDVNMFQLKMYQNKMSRLRCLVIAFDLSDAKQIYNNYMEFISHSNFVELDMNEKMFLMDRKGIVIEDRVSNWINVYGRGMILDSGPK